MKNYKELKEKVLGEKRATFRDTAFELRNAAYENLANLEIFLGRGFTGNQSSEHDKALKQLLQDTRKILNSDYFDFPKFYKLMDIIDPE